MKRQLQMTLNDDDVEVIFDYQPEEKPTRDYPGCGEEIEVQKVIYKDIDIYPILSYEMIEEIETKIKEYEI